MVTSGPCRRGRALALVAWAERGQDVIDYGILIATIVIIVLLAVASFGNQITPWFQNLAGRITTVGT
jgi:hypothetical protein